MAPAPGHFLLIYVVLPLWVAAGHLDWWCHRATRIETTAGLKESLFHLVMFCQMGTGVLLAAFFQTNYLLITLLAFVLSVHELTTWLELRWVDGKRHISPAEQLVHSFLEILPLAALLLLSLEAQTAAEGWTLQRRVGDVRVAVVVAGAVLVFNAIPLLEELFRCGRARRAAKVG